MQLVLSAKKNNIAGIKREETCNSCPERENMQLVSSAGKRSAGVNRVKTHVSCS